jgi:predicted SAM-dependent methyltransferase
MLSLDGKSECLNVGCGLSVGRSWLNVDGSYSLRLSRLPGVGTAIRRICRFPDWPGPVVYGNIVKGLRIPPSSCQLIYASHVLEHLSLQDFTVALANVYSYLRPGGYLRCIVPDLEAYTRQYLDQLSSADTSTVVEANSYFMTRTNLGVETRSSVISTIRESLGHSRHQWMWDRPSLEKALRQVGFDDIRFRHYGEWVDERFREVEAEGRHVDSICVEARKPV